ncbi:MAG: peptidoglycan-binding protein [candidate division Zixibacteria bacterium]|nr:peptidoglycan-binding protein [candidate division Zixibacteria bacterium]
MNMVCDIVSENTNYAGVVTVRVPGIYGKKGNPLPKRMSLLVRPAAVALGKTYHDIAAEGGHLYISDMFRSAAQQQKAHEDWKTGRKSAYSPPSCASVHEAARAIDIDAYDTGIGHKRVREILRARGWTNIVDTLTGLECWHYEFRGQKWETYLKQHGYQAMARAMKQEIGNIAGISAAEKYTQMIRDVQTALNTLIAAGINVNGEYDENTKTAVRAFQYKYRLQVDGVAGPITRQKIQELLAAIA